MEKAIKINYKDFLSYNENLYRNYQWIYTGTEFCENLLELYLKRIDIIKRINKKICFLTPIFTDKSKKILEKIIFEILKIKNKDIEITINDFGALNIIEQFNHKININAGRHLTKNLFKTINNSTIIAVDVESIKFVKKYKINRFELTILNNKLKSKIYPLEIINDLNFTFYYPYFNITTSRSCIMGTEEIKSNEDVRDLLCNYECLKGRYKIKLKDDILIADGNTLFKKYNLEMDKFKLPYFVDRIVYIK